MLKQLLQTPRLTIDEIHAYYNEIPIKITINESGNSICVKSDNIKIYFHDILENNSVLEDILSILLRYRHAKVTIAIYKDYIRITSRILLLSPYRKISYRNETELIKIIKDLEAILFTQICVQHVHTYLFELYAQDVLYGVFYELFMTFPLPNEKCQIVAKNKILVVNMNENLNFSNIHTPRKRNFEIICIDDSITILYNMRAGLLLPGILHIKIFEDYTIDKLNQLIDLIDKLPDDLLNDSIVRELSLYDDINALINYITKICVEFIESKL